MIGTHPIFRVLSSSSPFISGDGRKNPRFQFEAIAITCLSLEADSLHLIAQFNTAHVRLARTLKPNSMSDSFIALSLASFLKDDKEKQELLIN